MPFSSTECGGRFYNPSGMISYPSEPGVLYPHGIDCEWVITASSSKVRFLHLKIQKYLST